MAATQDDMIAELQRANAALQEKLDSTLAQRNSEYGERIAHQAATNDVLKAMSASPGNSQPVFDLIARQAATLCNVPTAAVAILEGTMLHLATQSGFDPAYADAYVSRFPRPVGADSSMGRAILNRQVEQVEDITADPGHSFADVLGHWSVMAVPILRDGLALGAITIGRPAMGPFSDSQIELLKTFAEQAVIAIGSAETYRALQTRTSDLQESLEYQTATSDVLKVISRSAFDLQPVLATLLKTAARLCDAETAGMTSREGDVYRVVATYSNAPAFDRFIQGQSFIANRASVTGRTALEGHIIHIDDLAADPEYAVTEAVTLGGVRTLLGVPLLREGEVAGVIILGRLRVEPFTDRQIDLVSTFADQAVIAIENTRLITDQREALEQQTATAEVLQVINASPGNLGPVFDAILEKAMQLCGAAFGELHTLNGDDFRPVALLGIPDALAAFRRSAPPPAPAGSIIQRIREGANIVHTADAKDSDLYRIGEPTRRALVDLGGARTVLTVTLRQDETLLGFISIYRQEVQPFSDRQIALLQNFAAQAVIAMENARLLNEVRQRQEELRITFENMGDGVAMFDETPRLVAWNRKFKELLDVPDEILAERRTYADYIRYLTERGEFGADADTETQLRRFQAHMREHYAFERTRPDGRVIEVRHNPVPDGGFVLIYADITERKRSEAEIRAARDAAEEASRTIEAAYRDLKTAQAEQAVVAMENARLIGELRQRTEEVAELNRGLEARVAAQVEELGRVGRLRRFLAPQLAELIVSRGDEKILESHRREIVVVFCDLRGYTAFAETAEPEEVLDFLREYHGALGPLVSQHEGTLDQFSGDGIMVFFNDPVPIPDPAERAIKMAVAMREAARLLIAAWHRRGRNLGFGAGIAQGYATLGQIGFTDRLGYTAIGTVCNVAARLCAEAKDGQILLSQRIAAGLDGSIALEELGPLALKGLTQPIVAYNVPAAGGQAALRVIEGRPDSD
jgi:PAS domain S-box-containing protein